MYMQYESQCAFFGNYSGTVKALETVNAGAAPGEEPVPGGVAVTSEDAEQNPPPPPTRIGPNGRIETEEEYQARMAHNAYMRFSRSLRRTLVCI